MKKTQKDNDKLIVKSNEMIEASYRLTLQEQRIILYMAAQIQPHDEDFKPIRLNISKFAELIELEDENYIYMQQVTRKLLEKVMTIRKGRTMLQIGWISSAEYFYGHGYFELCFDPKLKPYLLQLKERFTKYKLQYIIRFRHSYSIRFYELLTQYYSIGWRYFELDELRRILGIQPDQYKLYADFKRFILQPVKAEFNEKYSKGELDLTFDFKEIKEGRKVVGITFFIQKPFINKKIDYPLFDAAKENNDNNLVEKLIEMKLSRRQANSIVKKYSSEIIIRNIELTKKKNVEGEVNNVPAFLIQAIENDYAKDYKPSNSAELATLRAEANKCWSKNFGNCQAQWSTYKDNRTSACHFCAKFEKQRSL